MNDEKNVSESGEGICSIKECLYGVPSSRTKQIQLEIRAPRAIGLII